MRDAAALAADADVWGPYASYDDVARFEYGRRMWRLAEMRERLLTNWLDERHPHRERFLEHRALVEEVLNSEESVAALDAKLRQRGTTLRCLSREIPVVFGQWFETREPGRAAPIADAAKPNEYSLVRLRSGAHSVHARSYAETMHPGIGPAAEAEALYVRQTGLIERLRAHHGEFVIWDIGLGAGANALTALRQTEALDASLRLISFDSTDAPLRFASGHPAELPYLRGYEQEVARLIETRHVRFRRGAQRVDWTLNIADFPALLQSPAAATWPRPHLILFDPFSPARNPAMWTRPLLAQLYRLLDPARPCLLPTYSRSTQVRVTLLLAGFWVGTGRATGRKEETTVAANRPE